MTRPCISSFRKSAGGHAPLAGNAGRGGHRSQARHGCYPPLRRCLGIGIRGPMASPNHWIPRGYVVLGNALSRGNRKSNACWTAESLPFTSANTEDYFSVRTRFSRRYGNARKDHDTSCWRGFGARRPRQISLSAVLRKLRRSFGLGGGNEFVLEGDEYDSAFFDKARNSALPPGRVIISRSSSTTRTFMRILLRLSSNFAAW